MAQSLLANVKSQPDFSICLVEACTSRITGAASYLDGAIARRYLKSRSATMHGLGSAFLPFRIKGIPNGRDTGEQQNWLQIEALQRRGSEGVDDGSKIGKSGDIPALESGAWLRGKSLSEVDDNDPLWEQIGVGLRLTYAAGVYGLMALAGLAICHFTGIDNGGGFEMCPDAAMQGLGYAVPPMMALLFILDDEVVKKSPPARAIRDVEDEELLNFFVGMSPWQLMFVVALGSAAEELFFRIAVQGGLAHVFLSDEKITNQTEGIAALTGVFPCFAPFAHALAAVLAAALTGSILFITSFPQDPKYVIAPVCRNRRSQRDMKRSFAAWYERRQLRKIYSPLLDSFLGLYLGFEWIQTGNILAPIITHIIYTTVIVGNGLRRIHEQRAKLRERTQQVWQKEAVISTVRTDSKQ